MGTNSKDAPQPYSGAFDILKMGGVNLHGKWGEFSGKMGVEQMKCFGWFWRFRWVFQDCFQKKMVWQKEKVGIPQHLGIPNKQVSIHVYMPLFKIRSVSCVSSNFIIEQTVASVYPIKFPFPRPCLLGLPSERSHSDGKDPCGAGHPCNERPFVLLWWCQHLSFAWHQTVCGRRHVVKANEDNQTWWTLITIFHLKVTTLRSTSGQLWNDPVFVIYISSIFICHFISIREFHASGTIFNFKERGDTLPLRFENFPSCFTRWITSSPWWIGQLNETVSHVSPS